MTHGPLAADLETDVLVIGAGITGAMIADVLSASGLDVAIVDKRGLAKGSTTASTALVQYEIDAPLTKLGRKIGKEKAVRAWRRSRLAVDALAARLGELASPGVLRRNSLYLAGNILDKDALAREHEARRAAGLASLYLDRKAVFARFGIRREAALLGFGTLVLDPRRPALALLRAAVANGARIFAPVEITIAVDPQANGRHSHRTQRQEHSLPQPCFRDRL